MNEVRRKRSRAEIYSDMRETVMNQDWSKIHAEMERRVSRSVEASRLMAAGVKVRKKK